MASKIGFLLFIGLGSGFAHAESVTCHGTNGTQGVHVAVGAKRSTPGSKYLLATSKDLESRFLSSNVIRVGRRANRVAYLRNFTEGSQAISPNGSHLISSVGSTRSVSDGF